METDIDSLLDVCGVCCPMPLIELAKAVRELAPGQTLEITGNDPIFEPSVRDFCQANHHDILEVRCGETRRVSMLIRIGS